MEADLSSDLLGCWRLVYVSAGTAAHGHANKFRRKSCHVTGIVLRARESRSLADRRGAASLQPASRRGIPHVLCRMRRLAASDFPGAAAQKHSEILPKLICSAGP